MSERSIIRIAQLLTRVYSSSCLSFGSEQFEAKGSRFTLQRPASRAANSCYDQPHRLWQKLQAAGGGLQGMAFTPEAYRSIKSCCGHRNSLYRRHSGQRSFRPFTCSSQAISSDPVGRRKPIAKDTKHSLRHTEALIQLPQRGVLPPHASRTYRDDGALSEITIADALAGDQQLTDPPELQATLANAQLTVRTLPWQLIVAG